MCSISLENQIDAKYVILSNLAAWAQQGIEDDRLASDRRGTFSLTIVNRAKLFDMTLLAESVNEDALGTRLLHKYDHVDPIKRKSWSIDAVVAGLKLQ